MNSSLVVKALELDNTNECKVLIGGLAKKNDYLEHLDLEQKKCKFISNKISCENIESILMSLDQYVFGFYRPK